MVKDVVDYLKAHPDLFADTALIITFDEGGGFYDSGYIQPLDFFGDGPRSRDNFPNPKADDDNPYVPLNSPAIGDLFDIFHFDNDDQGGH
jgi:phospholipase C